MVVMPSRPSARRSVYDGLNNSKNYSPVRPVGIIVLCSSVAVGVAPVLLQASSIAIAIGINAGLVLAFTGLRMTRRRLDLTESINWIQFALLTMYVIHPLYVLSDDKLAQPFHQYYDLNSTYVYAIVLGGCAIAAVNVGYWAGSRASAHRIVRHVVTRERLAILPARTTAVAAVCLGAGLIGMAKQNPFSGPTSAVVGQSSSAYSYLLPLFLLPAGLLFRVIGTTRDSHLATCLGYLSFFILAINLTIAGSRYSLICIVATMIVFEAVSAGFHINRIAFSILIITCVLLLSALRDVNAPAGSSRTPLSDIYKRPVFLITEALGGDDTEMVDALAIEAQFVPSSLAFAPLSVPVATLTAPVPRGLWKGKPQPPDATLNALLFKRSVDEPGVAYGPVGEWYFSGGVPAVLVAFFAFGFLCAWILRLRTGWVFDHAIYATSFGLLLVYTRGSLAYMVAYVGVFLIPLLLAKPRSDFRRLAPEEPRPSQMRFGHLTPSGARFEE